MIRSRRVHVTVDEHGCQYMNVIMADSVEQIRYYVLATPTLDILFSSVLEGDGR